ncbi:hypothetical protein MOO46_06090 [Apilactobacillus apisilvae]|uniref:Uncharacterized protein n=1 Tax=Apilactobacillus apisilvae TaxID=2923364 RepID=A0ABY4PG70_9LACO|nr:hypothetical protein [Apilactobacillus apisilvae]UQS84813.1 hypothetical protein MOO46_06090 [Apilactobacillus apisilvae]
MNDKYQLGNFYIHYNNESTPCIFDNKTNTLIFLNEDYDTSILKIYVKNNYLNFNIKNSFGIDLSIEQISVTEYKIINNEV